MNKRWQDDVKDSIKEGVKANGQSTGVISKRFSPVIISRGLFVLFMLWILLFVAMVNSHAQAKNNLQVQAEQCFADPKQAYAYLIAQQQQQRLQADQAKHNTIININQAGEAELTQLSGIGSQKAQQIILYRETFGLFTSVDDLAKVKGIGAQTVANNRDRMIVQ
ncbi:ComEA family DNA-binding protein [Psychrobacter lutiphocae]|uniref:ComEA family DNA-binding protein n=1 Tax=Psychrobacter lutiphocae TaxID=540500 RepID=UPI00035C3D63|nr:ComEA family DNA-binding protein [Psychrobacter lutiphocae]